MSKTPELSVRLLSKRDSTSSSRNLSRHDSSSVIEKFVASHPLKTRDILYPTNIMVAEDAPVSVVRESRLEYMLETLAPQRLAGLVTIAVFSGYAALFSLQHVIKVWFEIPDDESEMSHNFSFAITLMYIWNLIFRVGHNLILYPFSPRVRSLCGMCAMCVSMGILAFVVFGLEVKNTLVVGLAYAFGGVSIGTFETNYSVVLAGLGNHTKIYGISGIPIGIFLVIVPGFILVASGMPVVWIYYGVLTLLAIGIVILLFFIEYPNLDALLSGMSDDLEVSNVEENRSAEINLEQKGFATPCKIWGLKVLSVGLVFTINMLCVSAFSPGVLLYLYNTGTVALSDQISINTGYFFAIFSSFGFVADVVSRRRIYTRKPTFHPIRYLVLTFVGAGLIVAQVPLIAPIGTYLIFFANGSIYAQSCRWLDLQLDSSVLVLGNSMFFFLGDCGSVLGATLIPFIRDMMVNTPM